MAEFSFADDKFRIMVERLIDADPFNLGHIDPDTIVYLYKEEKNPRRAIKMAQIPQPYILLTGKFYIMEISEELVEIISKEHLEIFIYRGLRQINSENGRVIAPDVIEWKNILDMYGFDWEQNSSIPSIFEVLRNKSDASRSSDDDNVLQMFS